MTDEAQIAAIAGACGYPKQEKRWLVPVGRGVCETAMHGFKSREEAVAWTVTASVMDPEEPQEYLEKIPAPDYLHSLDAMHEAWKTLDHAQQYKMAQELFKVVDNESDNGEMSMSNVADPIDVLNLVGNATARQRAEAFLRTLGLWQEAT